MIDFRQYFQDHTPPDLTLSDPPNIQYSFSCYWCFHYYTALEENGNLHSTDSAKTWRKSSPKRHLFSTKLISNTRLSNRKPRARYLHDVSTENWFQLYAEGIRGFKNAIGEVIKSQCSPGVRTKKVAYFRSWLDPFSRKQIHIFSRSGNSSQQFSMGCIEKYGTDKKL